MKAMLRDKKVNIAITLAQAFVPNFVIFKFLLMSIQNFLAAFWSLLNLGNFGLIIRKRCRKIKKSISQLPSCKPLW
jgi:hypothetical protein